MPTPAAEAEAAEAPKIIVKEAKVVVERAPKIIVKGGATNAALYFAGGFASGFLLALLAFSSREA